MKKLTLSILTLFFPLLLMAQICTPDPQYTEAGIFPDSTVGIPATCVGEIYTQVITIIVADQVVTQFGTFQVEYMTLNQVDGLPQSFTYDCEPANCTFYPNIPYCILVTGTSQVGDIGSHNISFAVEAKLVGIGQPVSQYIENFYTLVINDSPVADAGSDVTINPGDNAVLGGQPTASGGSQPYTYAWSPSASLNDGGVSNPSATPSQTTTYSVIVTDANGCNASDQATVEVSGTISVNAGSDVNACAGDTVTLGVTNPVSGGTQPYTYTWTAPDGSVVGNDPTLELVADLSFSGNYILSVEDNALVQADDTVHLQVNALPTVSLNPQSTFCKYNENKVVTGGTPVGGLYFVNGNSTSIVNPSLHTGSVEVVYVYSDGTCSNSDNATINILDLPAVNAGTNISVSMDLNTQNNVEVDLDGSGDGNFLWSPANLLDDPTIANPTATVDTTTTFTLTVTGTNGCINTDEVLVQVDHIVLPSVYDPNNVKSLIDIYPVPVESALNIKFSGNTEGLSKFNIYDLQGRVVKSFEKYLVNHLEIDFRNLETGIYILQIKNQDFTISYRIIKQ